jgi:peroxiredoxin
MVRSLRRFSLLRGDSTGIHGGEAVGFLSQLVMPLRPKVIVMKTVVMLFLMVPFALIYSQTPDTLVVKTERIKGFGPFSPGTRSRLVTMDPSNNDPWPKTIPTIKGLPPDHGTMLYNILVADFFQYVYQNYNAGNIPEADYNDQKKWWDWDPSPAEFTREHVKLDIAILACTDSSGTTKVKVDRNNNYDLSDDEWYTLPPILPGQSVQGRYNDLLPFEVEYQLFDGRKIGSYKSWLYVDYWSFPKGKAVKSNQLQLAYAFAECHVGQFTFNQKKYTLALLGSDGATRHNYSVKVSESDHEEMMPRGYGAKENELVQLGEFYYKVTKAAIHGSEVTLTRFGSVDSIGGTQVGLKAPLFSAKSIQGESIDLASLQGKYVLLEFWGSWCGPCQREMPKLRALYEKYKLDIFTLIGIAKDERGPLVSYIKENGITWPQILQDTDHYILRLYNIQGYPSKFLIDPEGKIVAKDASADELEAKLKQLFGR